MKLKFVYLVIGSLTFGSAFIRAEDTKPATPPSREEQREKFKNLSPAEREAKMKEWRAKQGGQGGEKGREQMREHAKSLGLNPEELKNLSPEERRAKVSEAVKNKTAELNKKKADGTITDEETKQLAQIEEMKKRFEEHRRGPGPGPGGDAKPEGRDARKPAAQNPDEKK